MKGMLVMFPGQKPSMVRVDQLSYAWSQDYKRREFVKFRHLVANTAKPSNNDSWELEVKTSCSQPPATDWTDVVKTGYQGIRSTELVTSCPPSSTKQVRENLY